MITTIAALLRDLMKKEAERLDGQDIAHGPTIGSMYEGLTRDILDRAIPADLDVRVVDGFVRGVDGRLSPQMDAMVVVGEGAPIPYTSGFVWPIADVVAVLEVKKSLYGADLEDAFVKLREIKRMSEAHIQAGAKVDPRAALRAFAKVTGHYPRTMAEVDSLPNELSLIFHTMLADQQAPLRVILGYHGYSDEHGLRKGLVSLMEGQGGTAEGFGATSLPNLIVARSSSLLKMDGNPYVAPLVSDWWPVLTSNAENPLRILIELLWTKLGDRFGAAFPADDELQLERLAPYLNARIGRSGTRIGWEYDFNPLSREELASATAPTWSPETAEVLKMVVQMQIGRRGSLDVREAGFRRHCAEEGVDPDVLIADMIARRMLAWSGPHEVTTIDAGTMFAGFMPTGEGFTTTNSDLLAPWLHRELGRRGK